MSVFLQVNENGLPGEEYDCIVIIKISLDVIITIIYSEFIIKKYSGLFLKNIYRSDLYYFIFYYLYFTVRGIKMALLAYFGHHKCASKWINLVMMKVCEKIGLKHGLTNFIRDLKGFVNKNNIQFLSEINAKYSSVVHLDLLKAFHVVRDPRDILVSAYFSHLYSHPVCDDWPELVDLRKKLSSISQEEGLLYEMEENRGNFERMGEWNYKHPDILEIKMEPLTKKPFETFTTILNYLNLLDDNNENAGKITMAELKGILDELNFSKLSGGRKKGEENLNSHYRKGVAGDWKNHFKSEHVTAFKKQYGRLLITLGYERDFDWDIIEIPAKKVRRYCHSHM